MCGLHVICRRTCLITRRRWRTAECRGVSRWRSPSSADGRAWICCARQMRQTCAVSNGELRQRAADLGISVNYWDWHGREVTVSDETLEAIMVSLAEARPDTSGFVTPDAV